MISPWPCGKVRTSSGAANGRDWSRGMDPFCTPATAPAASGLSLDSELDERRPPGLAHAEVLEIEGLREVLEEALSTAEDDGGDDDVELVDDPGIEPLSDHVGAATDAHRLVAGGSFRAVNRGPEAVDEVELAGLRLFLRPMRDDEDGHTERVLAAPVPCGLIHVAADDGRPVPGHLFIQVVGVRALGFAARAALVRPRATEDPVVQALAALAKSLVRAVIRSGDVPVDRHRDHGDDLGHRVPAQEVEATTGFEPVNRGFAVYPVRSAQVRGCSIYARRAFQAGAGVRGCSPLLVPGLVS